VPPRSTPGANRLGREPVPVRVNSAPIEEPPTRARKYHPMFARQVFELTLMFGDDDKAIARVLLTSVRSLNAWRQKYPEFADACRRGADVAHAEVIATLRQRALGYSYTTQKAVPCGKGEVKVVEVTETLPPDVKAMELWLTRHPKSPWYEPSAAKLAALANTAAAQAAQAAVAGQRDPYAVIVERLESIKFRIAQDPAPARAEVAPPPAVSAPPPPAPTRAGARLPGATSFITTPRRR